MDNSHTIPNFVSESSEPKPKKRKMKIFLLIAVFIAVFNASEVS